MSKLQKVGQYIAFIAFFISIHYTYASPLGVGSSTVTTSDLSTIPSQVKDYGDVSIAGRHFFFRTGNDCSYSVISVYAIVDSYHYKEINMPVSGDDWPDDLYATYADTLFYANNIYGEYRFWLDPFQMKPDHGGTYPDNSSYTGYGALLQCYDADYVLHKVEVPMDIRESSQGTLSDVAFGLGIIVFFICLGYVGYIFNKFKRT